MDNFRPSWITKALKMLCNERGEVVIPFIDKVAEESRPAVTNFITNAGVTSEDLAKYDSFDSFISEYKPKAAQAADWTTGIPEEQKPLLNVKGWKTPADVVKGYSELEKFVGHDKIPAPKKDKNGNYEKGELERVMSALGMPKDPAGYKEAEDFKLPEGVTLDDKTLAEFKAEAHKAGMLPHQYAFMMDKYAQRLTSLIEQGKEIQKKENEDGTLSLRTKWGMKYEENVKLANSILQTFAGDKSKAAEVVSKYGNDPVVIELMANIGSNLSEESLSKVGMTGSLLTPESARYEINKVRGDANHPYFKAEHPDHMFWVNRMSDLYKMVGD